MYLILACVLNKVSLRIYLETVHWIFCATTAKYKGKSRQMTERGVRGVKDCNICMVKEIFIRMLKLKNHPICFISMPKTLIINLYD